MIVNCLTFVYFVHHLFQVELVAAYSAVVANSRTHEVEAGCSVAVVNSSRVSFFFYVLNILSQMEKKNI